ncbi:MAG: CDP-alcohol phosphatidyltransferase family protein [Alphaproteobacteria bacterium]|nr:CDP-alcohol phosphatidyltransferase family protein [Alphaproteobacteria bacterium]
MRRLFPNLPNILTSLRLLMAPVLAVLVLGGHHRAAFGVFVFAGLSDAADGYLAKRFDLGSALGRILDPAADKLLMLASFLALSAVGATPVWLTALVIGRDVGIVAGALSAWTLDLPLKVAPLPLGKICTALQITYIALILLLLLAGRQMPDLVTAAELITAAITLASGLNYAALWLRALIVRPGRTA